MREAIAELEAAVLRRKAEMEKDFENARARFGESEMSVMAVSSAMGYYQPIIDSCERAIELLRSVSDGGEGLDRCECCECGAGSDDSGQHVDGTAEEATDAGGEGLDT